MFVMRFSDFSLCWVCYRTKGRAEKDAAFKRNSEILQKVPL